MKPLRSVEYYQCVECSMTAAILNKCCSWCGSKEFDLISKDIFHNSSDKITNVERVVFAVEGEDFLRSAFGDGCCLTSRSENKYDLFMQMEKKFQLVWQHTDGINRGVLYSGSTHTTRKAAEELAVGSEGGPKKFIGIFEYEE